MKIRYSELADCLRDPEKWVTDKLKPTAPKPRGGYDQCLRLGIFHFHKHNNIDEAREYIFKILEAYKLLNGIRVEDILDRFDAYVTWMGTSRNMVAAHRVVLSFELVDGIALGGMVSRIDIVPSGYRAVLLGHAPTDWEQQIHMPLIQRALARQYGRAEERFSVGYQDLDGSNLTVTTFPTEVLDHALSTIQQMAGTVASELRRRNSDS